VELPLKVERLGLRWIRELKIDSHRTEMALFEAARAYAAADSRMSVTEKDLRAIAPLALRQRHSDSCWNTSRSMTPKNGASARCCRREDSEELRNSEFANVNQSESRL